jgi:hypothetical protein
MYEITKYDFIKADKNIKYKKEVLYDSKNIGRWDMNPEDMSVIDTGNKELIMSKMLYKVSVFVI